MSIAQTASRRASLSDHWFSLRNRLLSNPRFQRWAARFPLSGFIAHRRAAAVFDLCAGFVYSQILQAVVEVGLLEALSRGPQTVTDLAPRLSLSTDGARTLLDAAVSLKLVERRGQRTYGLGVHGAAMMANPAVATLVAHHSLLYRDLADPVALLRGERPETELSRFWSYAGRRSLPPDDSTVAGYSALMTRSLSLIAEDILEAYPLARHRCLLDIGGGEGAFLEAAAAWTPHLSLVLFDLPPVALLARERLARAGLSSRATVVGGDLLSDPLPSGADLVSLVRVIHDHDDDHAMQILRAVHAALPRDGVLVLAEPMSGTSGAEPMGDAYFGLYLLAMGSGRPRTRGQLEGMLRAAGFEGIRPVATSLPIQTRVLVGRKRRTAGRPAS